MRKNLKRIASLAIACVLLSVPAFAALEGSYADGTYTVSGGETGLQTSLIIVEGAYDELPINNEEVTGAVYIDQVTAAENGAAFEGVSLPGEVYTAFFSNESENSASSAKIVNATLSISATPDTVEEGQEVIISVSKPDSADEVAFTVNNEAAALVAKNGGYAFVPAAAGAYTIVATTTVAGQTITSDPITVTATAAATSIIEPNAAVVLEDVYTVDENDEVKNGEIVTPVYINLTLPAGTLSRMKWVLNGVDSGLVCSETFDMENVAVSGDTTFAAIIKNGLHQDGVDNDHEAVSEVGAIFEISEANYYTSEAIQNEFEAE